MSKTVIIGGVAAGASCAARLRRLNEDEEIILIERGDNISYANCGLPYHVGDVIPERSALLVTKNEVMRTRYHIDVRTNSEVTSISRDERTVHVVEKNGNTYDESYDHLVLATGSSPLKPPIPGIDSSKIKTLWTVPDTDAIKHEIQTLSAKRIAVIGGGFIGLEMAENLHHIGLDVTIVEAADQVMAPVDPEMAAMLHKHIRAQGVQLILKDGVAAFHDETDGVRIQLSSGQSLTCDLVILSIGVRPNSELAKDAGLELNSRGGVLVDAEMHTSDPAIYAAGDVVEVTDLIFGDKTMVPLAGPANKQGRIVADQIAGISSKYNGTQGSSVAKVFQLTVAATGASEKTLIRRGMKENVDYRSIQIVQNHHAGYYPGAKPMVLKLLFSMDGNKIYGAQIIGYEGVDKRIDTLATVIRLNGSVFDLTELELAYAPPYSSTKDPVNMAGFVAENVIRGYVTFASWDAVEQRSKNTVILDVRELPEYQSFAIPESVHIPLGVLRKHLKDLDPSKHYLVFCAVGVRAYNAARLLSQNGFSHVTVYPGGMYYYRSTHM